MGVGISGWNLARAVSAEGQLGVVSGTALDVVLARQLQKGDEGGHLRRALEAFPLRESAQRILNRYFIEGGKDANAPYLPVPQVGMSPSTLSRDLMLAGSFAFVYLAKTGHSNPVGINLLEKIRLPTLFILFGAMLAGVDIVLMGAGIPRHIPEILDRLAEGKPVALQVEGSRPEGEISFDPRSVASDEMIASLQRPRFLAIVSSVTLARHLVSKATGKVDGFVVEGHTAGGHNAPPRKKDALSAEGEPVYGPKDLAEPEEFQSLGLPFWLAGGYGRPGGLQEALSRGASGIQVGTAFAFCEESGLDPAIRQKVLRQVREGENPLHVFTDPLASPTGFPFKVVPVAGSLSEPEVYAQRDRICDIGLLREVFEDGDGKVNFRCPAEVPADYVKKGGQLAETEGRICLCNGLLATIGLGQVRDSSGCEPALVTAGDDVNQLGRFLAEGKNSYHAREVVELLMQDQPLAV